MKKRGLSMRDVVEPLISVPYGFWGIYLYENGFDLIVAVLAIVLFIVVPGIIIVFKDKL